jgi:hypothetical protein
MTAMHEIRRFPPLDATLALVALGFEPIQAARLVALRLRLAPDGLDAAAQKRLLFARWLVEHGRLSDGASAGPLHASPGPDRSARLPSDAPRTP